MLKRKAFSKEIKQEAVRLLVYGYTDNVKLLLAKGADIHVKDKKGKTALDYAKKNNRKATIKLLKKHGAK